MEDLYTHDDYEEADHRTLDAISDKVDFIQRIFNDGLILEESKDKARQIISRLGNI